MIGRAGRPGFDTHAEAVVMVVDDKKNYYKQVRIADVFRVALDSSNHETLLNCVLRRFISS